MRGSARRRARRGAVVAATIALTLATVGCTEDRSGELGTGIAPSVPSAAACSPDDLLGCARRSTIGPLVPDAPTRAEGEPIVIGMINQENTPVGSFPELSRATQAGVDFVNDQLGGIDGRPIELRVCNTKFSAEGSTACAQQFVQDGAPVVLGGIDVFGNGIDTLAANGVPFVGGIPVSSQSMRNANSFQWSGGIWGATVAFAQHAATVDGAKSVAIIYSDFGPITDGAEYGKRTLEALGATQVQMIPHPVVATDLSAPIQVAASAHPDAIFMLEADIGCKGAYDGVHNAGITAKVFYVGACASPTILAQVPTEETDGARFNVEDTIDPSVPDPDMALYLALAEKYAPGFDPIGAGTVSIKSFMNLYSVLRGLGGSNINPTSITDALAAQHNTASFMGHDYTCDGKQFGGLPATCSPQQVIAELRGGQLQQLGGWVDVGAVYPG
jgi:branched-chain amino acid transport system substrate-binding protein